MAVDDTSKRDTAVERRLAEVERQIAAEPRAKSVTGTWATYVTAGVWNVLSVRELSADKVWFKVEGNRICGGQCESPGNSAAHDWSSLVCALAEASGEATRHGDEYVFETRFLSEDDPTAQPCILRLRFAGEKVDVAQDGNYEECGFGFSANVEGTYERMDARLPKTE